MKKGLKKPIALLLSAMMIFSTSASAFPAMAEDNLIFEKAENNSIHSDYEFNNSESEITVTTCENEENLLETETTTVSTTTEVSVQYSDEQTENNPVEVYNSDYAVYAVSSSEYEQPEGDGSESNPYKISNSSQLFWFADQVNDKGETSINAVLTTNIVVNENIFDENGNLIADLEIWTPIGNFLKEYKGTFDGQNHTISGLYCKNNNRYVGLFGYNDSGTIKNVGIIDSYFNGSYYVGGVCGYNDNGSKIENSYNTGSVSGSKYVGGVCGYSYFGKIENSYNTGSVSGSEYVGGVCGYNYSTVKNSYNTGSVSGSEYVGGVCGYNYGTIENSYYNNSVYSGKDVGSNYGTVTEVSGKTSEQFASGEVAYLLGGIWGQEIGTDEYPVLNGKKVYENKTYTGCCEKYQGDVIKCEYSNTQKDAIYLGNHNFENGTCTGCGIYEPAQLVDNYYQIGNAGNLLWFAQQVNNERKTSINAILTADIVVNENIFDEDGNLITDLEIWTPIGDNSYTYKGTFDGNNHTISGLYFNNESIDNVGLFSYNDSGTIKNVGVIDSYFKGKDYVGGVCGYNNNGTIENSYNTGSVSGSNIVGGVCGYNNGSNSTIEKSYNTGSVSGSEYVGGVCGFNYGTITNSYNTGSVSGAEYVGGVCGKNYGTITNSYNTGSVSGAKDYVGGVCGYNYGTVKNSYNTGSVSGSNIAGGVCGYNNDGTIENSYNTGSVSGSNNVGGVCGFNNGTIKNTYYLETCNAEGTKFTNSYCTAQTSEQFASGEVAYRLGGIWGQKIGTDKLPVLNGKKVYKNTTYSGCCEKYQGDITYDYSNAQKDAIYLGNHNFKDNICTSCGTYKPIEPDLKDGYYQIENANHLFWFAKQVNSGKVDINAVLTADIVVNTNVLNKGGTLNSDSALTEWTPIGDSSNQYTGTFDGNNHKISGLYFNNSTDYVGLFGYNDSGTIKNVGIIDSYFSGRCYVGGVCGQNSGTIENSYNTGSVSGSNNVGGVCGENYGSNSTITNSYNTGYVSGTKQVGGVCGYNNSGTIENSYNTGTVNGYHVGGVCGENYGSNSTITNSYNTGYVSGSFRVGGVCGSNNSGTIENSYNTGSVSGTKDIGGVCGYNDGTIENSYYNNSVYSGEAVGSNSGTVTEVSGKTSEQFASGEVAYLLGEIWGQEIGTDKLPVLNSENKVIYSILENETSSSESYINFSGTLTAPIKEGYNFKGWYTYDESNDNHYTGDILSSSREYSNVTADSKIIAVYTSLGTASITINCDKEYTINGISKSSATTESYPIGSTVKLSCSDENFAYWQNSAGTILSRENEYSFVVTGKETISAVFNEIVDNKVTLIFESFYGQVIATKQLASGEIIDTDTISVPVRTGYNALGWDFDGDGKYDKNKDTLESAITRGFKSDARTVRIVQIYKLINENHKITVENGSGSGTYNQNDIVTAVAKEAETGMKFSHWEDSKGNILSYNEKYVFYVSEDLTIKAVYVAIENKIDAKGTTSIVTSNRIEIDKEKGKLSFVSMSTVPEGCKINKAGIIATNKSEVANSGEFTDKSAMFVRGMSSNKRAVRYTWTKGNVKSGETWYVRAYLVYTDSNGNVHTVYGDMVEQTYK